MLLWKNYGGESLPRSKLVPDSASPVRDSDRIAAQAMVHVPPPCFSHKTLRGRDFLGCP